MSATDSTTSATRPQETEGWWAHHRRQVWFVVRLLVMAAIVAAALWRLLFAPVLVASYSIENGTVLAEVLGTGTLEARTSAVIGPKVGGLIVEIAADQGDRVKAGSLLFRLEGIDIQQQVSMAEFDAAASLAALDRSRSSKQRVEAILIQAQANFARLSELKMSDITAQQDLDRAQESLSIAEADLTTAIAAIAEGENRRSSAIQYLEYQRAKLRDTTIEAPFDALVVRRDRELGDVVAAGSSVFQLVDVSDQMWISAWVDETELAGLEEAQVAQVVFRSEPSVVYRGTVARVGREVDRETREIVVDVVVEKLPSNWAVGQRAEVYIQVDQREEVLILPAEYLFIQEGKTGVLLSQAGKAEWREIEVGLRGRNRLEILGGLELGDVVVRLADSGGRLQAGRRIQTQ